MPTGSFNGTAIFSRTFPKLYYQSACYAIYSSVFWFYYQIRQIASWFFCFTRCQRNILWTQSYSSLTTVQRVNVRSGCYFISTVPLQKPRFYAGSRAYFCRYLSEYSDNNSFLCMFIIWTYLSRFFCFFFCFEYSIKSLLPPFRCRNFLYYASLRRNTKCRCKIFIYYYI